MSRTDAPGAADRPEPSRAAYTNLPLPDPFPDYLRCPHCGEAEVEVWCFQLWARCHNCGARFAHTPAPCRGQSAICQWYIAREAPP